jgi:hypothetical protein
MHKFPILSLFGLLAVSITNAALLDSTLPPDYALILSRQAPGTPQFECHSNCGNALAGGRDPAHCTNATWTGYYEACLDCALGFDIWRIYGTGVSSAASACGLSATPSSESSGAPAASSVVPTTETSAAITTPSPPPPTPTPSATDAETAGSVVSSATSSVSTAGAASGHVVSAPGSVSLCVGVLVAGLAGLMGLL